MFDEKEEAESAPTPLRIKKLMELIEMLGLMGDDEKKPEGEDASLTVIEAEPKKLGC